MFYLKLSRAIETAELDHGISKFDSISKEILKRVASTDETTGLLKMKDLSDLGSFPTIQNHLNSMRFYKNIIHQIETVEYIRNVY